MDDWNVCGWRIAGMTLLMPALMAGCLDGEQDRGEDVDGERVEQDTTETSEPETGDAVDTAVPDTDTGEDTEVVDSGMAADDGGSARQNLLANARFEKGGERQECPPEWTCKTYAPKEAGQFSVVADEVRDGNLGARWSGPETAGTVLKQSVPSESGTSYEVAVWVQGEDLASDPYLEILFDGADDRLASESFSAEGANEGWTKIEGTTSPAPSGTESVRFNLSLADSGGTVLWDEASMVERDDGGMRDTGVEEDGGDGDHGVTVGGGSEYLAQRRSDGEPTYCNPTGTVVSTYSEFVNAMNGAGRGDVVYVDGDAEIDMQNADDFRIPEGITLASDRGCDGSDGGLLYTTNHPWSLFRTDGDVTIFGIRIRGPRTDWTPRPGENEEVTGAGVMIEGKGVEIANSEVSGFSHFGIQTDHDSHIHHNHIHHNPMKGLGYGVSTNGGHPIIEFNKMNYNRHSVASSGNGSGYTVRYNIVGPNAISHIFDQHKPGGTTTKVHHNTVKAVEQDDDPKNTPTVTIRGVPSDVASIHHNWIYNTESPCHSDGNWPGCAILQMHVTDWNNVEFNDNHYGTSEPASCDIGAPRAGCPAP